MAFWSDLWFPAGAYCIEIFRLLLTDKNIWYMKIIVSNILIIFITIYYY
jgi:hypothetical protein